MKRYSIIILLLFVFSAAFAQNGSKSVPFTLEDRDRIIKTEQKIESLRNEMNTRFESVDMRFDALQKEINIRFESQQQQIDDIKSLMYWGFGIIISLIIFVLAFNIWDRRTALIPLREKVEKNEKTQNDLKRVLIEYSQKDPKLAEILRTFGIL